MDSRVVELGLVVVADRGAVDHHRGSFDRLPGLPLGSVTEILEAGALVLVDRQDRPSPNQVVDLAPLGDQGRALVEGDLVDPEVLLVVGQQPDQRFPDSPGPDDMDDVHGLPFQAIVDHRI